MNFILIENAYSSGYDTLGNAVLEAVNEDGSYACAGYVEDGCIQVDYFDENGSQTAQKIVDLFDLDNMLEVTTFEQAIQLLQQINKNKKGE